MEVFCLWQSGVISEPTIYIPLSNYGSCGEKKISEEGRYVLLVTPAIQRLEYTHKEDLWVFQWLSCSVHGEAPVPGSLEVEAPLQKQCLVTSGQHHLMRKPMALYYIPYYIHQ